MKDSIFFVPVAEDFIDLEHLLRISSISFSSLGHTVGIELTYMFMKEKTSIFVSARELFTPEEMKQYEDYKISSPVFSQVGNELGEKFRVDSLKKFEEKVRLPIYNAWNDYRNSKIKI